MIRGIEWVVFAVRANPWDTRCVLAARLAERDPVVMVRAFHSVLRNCNLPTLKSRVEVTRDLPRLTKFTALHYPERTPLFGQWLGRLGRRRLASEVNGLLPCDTVRRVACYDSPGQFDLVGKMGESLSVYLAVDDRTVTLSGERIAGEVEAECRLLAKVHRVVCVSEPLAETLRSRASNRELQIGVLPNGYNERLFDPDECWPLPEELRRIPSPRVLVAGHVSDRIDWQGIAGAAAARPAWSWVFVGPADRGMKERISAIVAETGANMQLNSPVDWQSVPALIAHSDACAVPYRLNAFTRASSPLKAIEYLAMGAPVIATKVPTLSVLGESILWVDESQGNSYAEALDKALVEGRAPDVVARRRESVRGESWAAKALRLRSLLGVEE